jgi:hypothetical protein
MRKDIFIVGARLLGVWISIGAFNPLIYVLAAWSGFIQHQSAALDYNLLHGAVDVIAGLYLVFRTENLFDLLERVTTKAEAA